MSQWSWWLKTISPCGFSVIVRIVSLFFGNVFVFAIVVPRSYVLCIGSCYVQDKNRNTWKSLVTLDGQSSKISLSASNLVRNIRLALRPCFLMQIDLLWCCHSPVLKHMPKVSVITKNNIDSRSGSHRCVASKSKPRVFTQPNNVSIPHRFPYRLMACSGLSLLRSIYWVVVLPEFLTEIHVLKYFYAIQ